MIYTFVACVCICAAVLAGTWGYEQYLMNDVVTLSLKKEQMTQNIQQLEKRGGNAQIKTCDSHACIQVNKSYGEFGNNNSKPYYVIS